MKATAGRLNYLLQRDGNSLDFIRFLAAIFVIFSHSFPLGYGNNFEQYDPLVTLSNSQYTFGGLAVAIFFLISGFLIAASIDRSQDWVAYVKARFLRIYPGYFVVVLLTVFVLGPLMTRLSLGQYFQHPDTYSYLKVLLIYKTSYFLPGVFDANIYTPNAVNGSLWTLFFEILFYGMVLFLWAVRLLNKRVVLSLFVLVILSRVFFLIIYPHLGIEQGFLAVGHSIFTSGSVFLGMELQIYFMSGMVFYLYKDSIPLERRIVWLSLPLMIVAILAKMAFLHIWVATFGIYDLFYLATVQRSPFNRFSKRGDYSYGLYIYAFPVQQSLVHIFGGAMLPMLNFVLAVPITLVFAVLSWHLVEKPALSLRKVNLPIGRKIVRVPPG